MNFIIRNLGWILLIIFFIFMLYLISNQNNTSHKVNSLTQTGITFSWSSDVKKLEIKEKIKLRNQDIKIDKSKIKINKISQTGALYSSEASVKGLDKKEAGVFDSIREFFTIKKGTGTGAKIEKVITKTLTWEVNEDLIKEIDELAEGKKKENKKLENKKEEKKIKLMTFNDRIKKEDIINNETYNKIKGIKEEKKEEKGLLDTVSKKLGLNETNKKEKNLQDKIKARNERIKKKNKEKQMKEKMIAANKKEVKKVEKKKVEKKTVSQIKKVLKKDTGAIASYEVSSYALNLNNAWFTKKLWVIYRWDTVEQLTSTNRYGCFKIKVLNSKVSSNVWKIAWACKYYMKGYEWTVEQYKQAARNYYSSLVKSKNKKVAGKNRFNSTAQTFSVKVASLKLNNKSFNKTLGYLLQWDLVQQLTKSNSYGCFRAVVVKSRIASLVQRRGWVCKGYLQLQ